MKFSNPTIVFERRLPGINSRVLASFVLKACSAVGLKGDVSVLITGSTRMCQLNGRFRGKDRSTDVLSFPAASSTKGLAGDIAVSLDIAAHNARLFGHSVSDEIRVLILHGILHLAGYDHENDQGEMAKRETLLRRRFALPTGLIERESKPPARERPAKAAPALARSR